MTSKLRVSIIDEKKLNFDIISDISELSIIDPETRDPSDTLNVRRFLCKEAEMYRNNNLTSIWKVSYEIQLVAFFTISMNGMEAHIIPDKSRVEEMKGRYPAYCWDKCGLNQILGVKKSVIGYVSL